MNAEVWVLCSTKGGCGKSTLAAIIASEMARIGQTVTLIDADENAPFVRFANKNLLPNNLKVIKDDDPKGTTLSKLVQQHGASSDFVLIDTEGSENIRTVMAIQNADLAIIPFQYSELDEAEALKIINFVQMAADNLNREIPFVAVPNNVDAAIETRLQKRINERFQERSIPVIDPPVLRKQIFKEMFEQGRLLHDVNYEASEQSLRSARENAEAVCLSIANAR